MSYEQFKDSPLAHNQGNCMAIRVMISLGAADGPGVLADVMNAVPVVRVVRYPVYFNQRGTEMWLSPQDGLLNSVSRSIVSPLSISGLLLPSLLQQV